MTNYLSIIVAAALVNNLILIQLFGVSSLFYSTKKLPQAIEFALFNFVVLFLSLIINLIIYRFFLIPFHLEFFRLVVFVATSALLTTLFLQVITKRYSFSIRQQGLLLFLTGGNSAVLGATLLSSTNVLSLHENIAYSFGAALGYFPDDCRIRRPAHPTGIRGCPRTISRHLHSTNYRRSCGNQPTWLRGIDIELCYR